MVVLEFFWMKPAKDLNPTTFILGVLLGNRLILSEMAVIKDLTLSGQLKYQKVLISSMMNMSKVKVR